MSSPGSTRGTTHSYDLLCREGGSWAWGPGLPTGGGCREPSLSAYEDAVTSNLAEDTAPQSQC